MNAINVIAPYKHRGQWVFDDPRVCLSQDLLSLAPTRGWTVWSLTFPMLSKGSRSSFPARRFPAINTVSIGGAKRVAEIGIILPISTWKAGCVRRFLDISELRQKRFMCKSKHEASFCRVFCLSVSYCRLTTHPVVNAVSASGACSR